MTTPVDGSFDLSSLGLGVPAATKTTALGQTDFLNLMMTELKNQDPTKPMDSGDIRSDDDRCNYYIATCA